MSKKKKNSSRREGNRFFRWIRSDLPDEEDKKSPVLLLGVNKISSSPYLSRRSTELPQTSTGSIRFFRPPKSKYIRGSHADERLEKIRQDLHTHKYGSNNITPSEKKSHKELQPNQPNKQCVKLNCAQTCVSKTWINSSNHGSFSFSRNDKRHSSLCPSELYGFNEGNKDYSESEIEFKYTEHPVESQPSSSKQNSYNVTPKSTERRSLLLANLNERFRKTLSLDYRKVDASHSPLSLPKESRPKSLINTSNTAIQPYYLNDPLIATNFNKATQPKKKRKSFFSLDTFFDTKKSETSSVDDFCSSKYKRFELESDDSPVFRRDKSSKREKTPDLLKAPLILDSVRKKQSDTKRQLEKLENHYYKSVTKPEYLTHTVIDAVPKDAKDIQEHSGHTNRLYVDDDDVEYIEPIQSNFTSQSTLILDKNIPQEFKKPDSILTINTDETDIKLPSSTVSPRSNADYISTDIDSLERYEIEVKEINLIKNLAKDLTVKTMDKSVDSIGSCSLDVDASTDFSDTTSGSLNLLTPSSTTSKIREFTSRIQERAFTQPNKSLGSQTPTPAVTPVRTPDFSTPTPTIKVEDPAKIDNLLKPPPKVVVESSHRSRHKKREEVHHKKPSYLNLACSVNGYTNLTTYDSKLRQDINRSREASPIRPIIQTYQYRCENNSLLVPVPVSADKLLVSSFGLHDTQTESTAKAPSEALANPHLITSPFHIYMASENNQLKNDFLGRNMSTASRKPYISNESKSFASAMLHQNPDEVDNASMAFKSSYSESNFRKTVCSNGKITEVQSESFSICSNGVNKRVEISKDGREGLSSPMKSFIQQRVERLYGPGALAQGFFKEKRHRTESQSSVFKDAAAGSSRLVRKTVDSPESYHRTNCTDLNLSLPVLRHLRPEFRAQLPIFSPKKGSHKLELEAASQDIPQAIDKTEKQSCIETNSGIVESNENTSVNTSNDITLSQSIDKISLNGNVNGNTNGCKEVIKDAYYFLALEKKETQRLLEMAAGADKELEDLQDKAVSEEVLGFLRSASGKARLLATQKMQQFQGLCYNNINESGEEQFPTTVEDLQGFWDMVCLQVKNVDEIYAQIARLKANNWEEEAPVSKPTVAPSPAPPRQRTQPSPNSSEKARLAAQKREADRKAMLEHRRRLARERQQAVLSTVPGTSHEHQATMGIEGGQEVEIFVGNRAKPSKVAPKGDCSTCPNSEQSLFNDS